MFKVQEWNWDAKGGVGGGPRPRQGRLCEVHNTHTLREMRPEERKDRMNATLYPVYIPAPWELMKSSVVLLL